MNALLLGAGGLLGRALAAAVPSGVSATACDRAALDVTDAAAVAAALARVRPDVIVNASAYTAVDRAESDPAAAWAVNATAVERLGRLAAAAGIRVVHVSTDYVFDGRRGSPYPESAEPAPLNAYGRSKLAGEQALAASGADALIVRTQWLFGTLGAGFPARMLDRARGGLPTRVVADQVGRPTAVPQLAAALWRLAVGDARGLLHVAGSEDATWHEVAELAFQRAGRPELLTPCTAVEYGAPARRPADSRLDAGRAASLLGPVFPSWRAALAAELALA